ncbi:TonB-dependent receptor domain-containing protein [Nitrospirillum viridazoti]|uniref:TonB-dependent receptor-like protein n=1 Tax=Nitrospirillum amazonense TaxID=28077 RepID=A0A560IBF3_9PROT|nr:TonB-dependent receptor [Nitrospirillum amazonense]TWB56362.1 TonB-dependent receptor-like protein [Nitrospirillum amazonense]
MREISVTARRKVWRHGIAAGALMALAATTAQAQQKQQAAADDSLEEIVVTGSRIARPNLTQPTPVQVINAEAIQATGLTSTVDVLSQLPQTQNDMGPSTNARFINGAGVNFANLRGLGEYRTLTLVDGKRHVGSLSGRNGSGGTSLVDLNSIPPALIERIEVVTGGTSAVYGADAVAGVVNVITKKNYEGAEATIQYNWSDGDGYQSTDVSAIVGHNFDGGRGNITLAVDYNHDLGLYGKDRPEALYNYTLVANPASKSASDGIPDRITISPTLSSVLAASGAPVIRTWLDAAHPQYSYTFKPDGSGIVPFNRGTLINGIPAGNKTSAGDANSIGGDGYNPSKYLTLRTPNIREVADTLVNYRLAQDLGPIDTLNFFADLKYSDSRGTSRSTPFTNGTGTPGTGTNGQLGSGALTIQADNAYLPSDLKALLATDKVSSFTITRVNDDWYGPREYAYEYEVMRGVFGLNGDLTNGWHYEAYYDYGRNRTSFVNTDKVVSLFNQQLDAVNVGGKIVCRDATAQANGCVPINPFVVGPLSAAQKAYAYTYTKEMATLQQHDAAFNLNGDLFKFPALFSGTVAPVSFAAGVEYRKEESVDKTDFLQNQPTGTIYGNQNGSVSGSYDTTEVYGELSVPVLRDLPFAKAVDLDLAYRYSDYSLAGPASTWNIQAGWAVNDDVKLRGGIARAVRAPNIDDLFTPAGDNFLGVSDPCSVENIGANATRAANCAKVVPAGYKSSDFGNPSTRTGGNINLKPEIGRTLTAGAVFTPTFIPGLNVTADYWLVKITQGQAALTSNSILTNCYDLSAAAQCGLITRRADGSIATIYGNTVNIGKEVVRGLDFQVDYAFELDKVGLQNMGGLNLGFTGTWVPESIIIQDPAHAENKLYRAGTVGYPHLKGRFTGTWDWNNLTVTWSSRFIGESETFPNSTAEIADFNKIPTYWYHDISARYRWKNVTVFGGINNLADKMPPAVPFLYQGSYQGGSYATFPVTTGGGGSYDVVGRTFFVGTTVKF